MSVAAALSGVLTLAAIEVGLSSPRAVKALGTTADTISAGVNRLISPDVGLIPNLHDTTNPTSSTSSTTTTAPAGNPKKLVQLNKKAATAVPTGTGRKPRIAPTVTKKSPLEQLLLGRAPSAVS